MATIIICIILVGICALGVKSYIGKLSHGCCGAGGDTVKRERPKDSELSHYPYVYHMEIEGMTCKNCAARIENAFHAAEGGSFYAKVNLKKKTAEIYAKEETSEEELRRIVIRNGYSVVSVRAGK